MSKSPNAVPDVGRISCPARHALYPRDTNPVHVIENVAGGRRSECVFCGVPWGDLDEQVRARLATPRGRARLPSHP